MLLNLVNYCCNITHVQLLGDIVIRVCYLARARAMARVVLAQIEFTWLAQISTYVTVIIFHDNSPLSYWNPVPIHDIYQTICTLAIHDYRYTIASDHQTTDTR